MKTLVLLLLVAPCLVGIAGPWINKAFNYNGVTLVRTYAGGHRTTWDRIKIS